MKINIIRSFNNNQKVRLNDSREKNRSFSSKKKKKYLRSNPKDSQSPKATRSFSNKKISVPKLAGE